MKGPHRNRDSRRYTLWYNGAPMSGPVRIPTTREASERPRDRRDTTLSDAHLPEHLPEDVEHPEMAGRPGRLSVSDAGAITRRITAIAVAVGVVMALGKAFLFYESGSVGVLASLVHSALDLTGAIASFFAVRFAARLPSGAYRFGRGKAEGVAAVFQMCLIVLASAHLLQESVLHFGHNHAPKATALAITGLLLFAGMTLWLIIAQSWAIRSTGSLAVRGDRAHYTADLLANVVVIIGLIIAGQPGLAWVDGAVGALFAVWLLWTAWRVGRHAWRQLMDVELPLEERDYLVQLAKNDARVRDVSRLRTRAAGPHIHILMQIDLDDAVSLTEAHSVCVGVERRIIGVYRAADVSVVPHPVDCSLDAHHVHDPAICAHDERSTAPR